MKWFAYTAAFLLALCTFQIISVALGHVLSTRPENKDYLAIVQIIVTFMSAVVFAFTGFATTRSNEEFKSRLSKDAALELAANQARLSVETSESIDKIRAQLTISTNETTERIRSQFSQAGEDFKARLGQIIPQRYGAYHNMYKAASKYFFAIRRLEEGIFPVDDLGGASAAADDALGSALLVDEADRSEFYNFVTEAHRLAEKARATSSATDIIQIWLDNGKDFGNRYNRLGAIFREKVYR